MQTNKSCSISLQKLGKKAIVKPLNYDSHHKHITTTHNMSHTFSHLPPTLPPTHIHISPTHTPLTYTSILTHPLHHTLCPSHTPPIYTHPPHIHTPLTTGAYIPHDQFKTESNRVYIFQEHNDSKQKDLQFAQVKLWNTSCIKMIGIGMCDILWKILKTLTIL